MPDPQAAAAPSLQLAFQTPTRAKVGDNFDVRVALTTRQPIARIVVEITYDPAVVRMRTTEDLDDALRTPGERAFSVAQSTDGQAEVVLEKTRRETYLELPPTAALAQFESIAAGSTEIRIANVTVFDLAGRPVPWSASGREGVVVIN